MAGNPLFNEQQLELLRPWADVGFRGTPRSAGFTLSDQARCWDPVTACGRQRDRFAGWLKFPSCAAVRPGAYEVHAARCASGVINANPAEYRIPRRCCASVPTVTVSADELKPVKPAGEIPLYCHVPCHNKQPCKGLVEWLHAAKTPATCVAASPLFFISGCRHVNYC